MGAATFTGLQTRFRPIPEVMDTVFSAKKARLWSIFLFFFFQLDFQHLYFERSEYLFQTGANVSPLNLGDVGSRSMFYSRCPPTPMRVCETYLLCTVYRNHQNIRNWNMYSNHPVPGALLTRRFVSIVAVCVLTVCLMHGTECCFTESTDWVTIIWLSLSLTFVQTPLRNAQAENNDTANWAPSLLKIFMRNFDFILLHVFASRAITSNRPGLP